MIFSAEIIAISILNVIFIIFSFIALVISIKIFYKWDINSTTKSQYNLEKNSFLGATIIKYIFFLKIPLFIFFVFTLDEISNILTGAMCGAGVIDATRSGIYLLILKIINLYIFALWISIHYKDIANEELPFTKYKFGIFIIIFWLLIGEIYLEFLFFSSLDVNKLVSCCGSLYSSSATSYLSNIFNIPSSIIISIFYFNFISMIALIKYKYPFIISNILFIITSIVSLIIFFSTYIYQLPSHHCPFCILQKDYYYIGYILYTSLFIGTFNGIASFINSKSKRVSIIFNSIYTIIVSLYVVVFYIKNGVWL